MTLAAAMAAYAAVELYRDPLVSWMSLGVAHAWHVVALALLLYLVLLVGFEVGFERLVGRRVAGHTVIRSVTDS